VSLLLIDLTYTTSKVLNRGCAWNTLCFVGRSECRMFIDLYPAFSTNGRFYFGIE
jgi:hypothetical protein